MKKFLMIIFAIAFVIALIWTKITGNPEDGTKVFRSITNFFVEPFAERIGNRVERVGEAYNKTVNKDDLKTSDK